MHISFWWQGIIYLLSIQFTQSAYSLPEGQTAESCFKFVINAISRYVSNSAKTRGLCVTGADKHRPLYVLPGW